MDNLGIMIDRLQLALRKDQFTLPMNDPYYLSRRKAIDLLNTLGTVLDRFSRDNPSIEQGGTHASSQRRELINKHLFSV